MWRADFQNISGLHPLLHVTHLHLVDYKSIAKVLLEIHDPIQKKMVVPGLRASITSIFYI